MSLIVPPAGAMALLDILLSETAWWCHLFTNDYTPSATTLLLDMIDPDWPAYQPQQIYGWSPAIETAGVAQSTADPLVWQRWTGGLDRLVYGYYVTQYRTSELLWAERRAAGPCEMSQLTDQCEVLPTLTLQGVLLVQVAGPPVAAGYRRRPTPPDLR